MSVLQNVKTLTDGYTIKNGIIQDSGKFEGESVATLYYYECFLFGGGAVMEISDVERQVFKIGKGYTHVFLYESDYGFVHLYLCTSQEEAEAMAIGGLEGYITVWSKPK